jgi:hypothetical protein
MHLIAAGRLYPKAWRQADQFRADPGKSGMPAWPSWCYLPMAAWSGTESIAPQSPGYADSAEPLCGKKPGSAPGFFPHFVPQMAPIYLS